MNEDKIKDEIINRISGQLANEQNARASIYNAQAEQAAYSSFNNPTLLTLQLDISEDKEKMHHLLSGHVMKKIQDKVTGSIYEDWAEPDDDRLKIFSDYGVKQIMNELEFYMGNRNILFGNYTEEEAKEKAYNFGIAITDLIFNRYEAFFYYPTPEELYEQYLPVVRKQNLNISEDELYISEDELYDKCIQWSQEELQTRLNHYPITILKVVDQVHATYSRAINGQERRTLREMSHISHVDSTSNSMGMGGIPPAKKGFFK